MNSYLMKHSCVLFKLLVLGLILPLSLSSPAFALRGPNAESEITVRQLQAGIEEVETPAIPKTVGLLTRRAFWGLVFLGLSILPLSVSNSVVAQDKKPAKEPKGSLAVLRKSIGEDKPIGLILWGPDNRQDLAALPVLFKSSSNVGFDTVYIGGTAFLQWGAVDQQNILNSAAAGGLTTLGFVDGKYDSHQKPKEAEAHTKKLTVAIAARKLPKTKDGKQLQVAFIRDDEPHSIPAAVVKKDPRKRWDADCGPLMDLAGNLVPVIERFAKANKGAMDPKQPPLRLLQPFWFKNGNPTEGPAFVPGSKIGGLRRVRGAGIAYMGYRSTSEGLEQVSQGPFARLAEENEGLKKGEGTGAAFVVESVDAEGENSFHGNEGKVGPVLDLFYGGLDNDQKNQVDAFLVHSNPKRAPVLLKALAEAKSVEVPPPAKEFGVKGGQATVTKGDVTLTFELTEGMQAKRWRAALFVQVGKDPTWYIQPAENKTAAVVLSRNGSVKLTALARNPLTGDTNVTGRAIVLLDAERADDFVAGYAKGGAGEAAKQAEKFILFDEKGKTEIVESLRKAGAEEAWAEDFMKILEEAQPQGSGVLVIEAAAVSRRIGLAEFVARVPARLADRLVLFGKDSAEAKELAIRNGIAVVDSDKLSDLAFQLMVLGDEADQIGYLGSAETASRLDRMLPMAVLPLDPLTAMDRLLAMIGYPREVLDSINASGSEELFASLRAA